MQTISASIAAVGFTPWLAVDYRQRPPAITINVIVPASATVTYNVDYTNDSTFGAGNTYQAGSGNIVYPTSITRAATVATVNQPNHNLRVNDTVLVSNTNFPPGNAQTTTLDGLFAVASVVDINNFTYTVANSGITTASGFAQYIPNRITTLTAFSAKTTSQDGSILFPVKAVRLNVTAYTGPGNVLIEVTQGATSA